MGRAKASVPPPAGKGTTRFTGFEGQVAAVWAREPTENEAKLAAVVARTARRLRDEFMVVSFGGLIQ
jgi:hypothetical protein